MPWFSLRQIIEEESFAADRQSVAADAVRLDAILEAVWLRLSKAAESGTQLPGSDIWVVLTAAFPDAPAIAVLYRFDDEHVYALALVLD